MRCRALLSTAILAAMCVATAGGAARGELRVSPVSIALDSPEASQQLLVSTMEGDRAVDVTRQARYEVVGPGFATIDAQGLAQPAADGQTNIVVRFGNEELRVPVDVHGVAQPRPVSFQRDVIPILTKARCNSGGCHGKAEGQNGFRLSIFGFDAAADYEALTKLGRGRRVMVAAPDESLLLKKGAALVPHGGGLKIEFAGYRYRKLLRWIAEGARFSVEDGPELASIEVEPRDQTLAAAGVQQLRVTAIDTDGTRRCVTAEAEFESNAAVIADVDSRGLITASDIPGEAAILARYLGHVAFCRVTLPRPSGQFARPPEANFIDRLVWNKLEKLRIEPSGLADDGMFLRRAYLDTIGVLPTAAEARAFLADSAADKRAKLIDALLARDEYATYWTMRWSDILRVDKLKVTPQGAVAMSRWLRRQFAENRPYNEFVREILTVQGNTLTEGPAGFYKVLDKPELASRSVSQLFLGVRIECAQCHHHPTEKWGQEDYYGLAGFFTGLTHKKLPDGAEAIVASGGADLKHPRTAALVPTHALGAPPADFTGYSDRRVALAEWVVGPDNKMFHRAIVNRLWSHYFGRGLVEPIDDMRETNPASNEPLMAALCDHLRETHYDLKAFTRTLLNSRAYQLSSDTTESNLSDAQNFSHAAQKAVPAEVLLDAICQSTGVPEKFNGWPLGVRAVEVWDNRMPSYFFRIFGRPVRASVCECERSGEPSIAQALHLLNSPEIMEKAQARHGRCRGLADSGASQETIVEELYLATLSRLPNSQEKQLMLAAFADGDRRAAVEDILWTLLNSKEFLYNH